MHLCLCVCLLCRGLRTVRRSDYANRASPRSEVVGNGLGSMSPNISPSNVDCALRLDTCRVIRYFECRRALV